MMISCVPGVNLGTDSTMSTASSPSPSSSYDSDAIVLDPLVCWESFFLGGAGLDAALLEFDGDADRNFCFSSALTFVASLRVFLRSPEICSITSSFHADPGSSSDDSARLSCFLLFFLLGVSSSLVLYSSSSVSVL